MTDKIGCARLVYKMRRMDLLTEFAIKIYEPPLCEMRDSGAIADLSNPIAVAMLVVDFETEVTMQGIVDFIGNSTGLYVRETVKALQIIGCDTQADQLQRILDIADVAGMTHDAIQEDMSGLAPHAITSFSKLHGEKWDSACKQISAIDDEVDYHEILSHAHAFVQRHEDVFRAALGR